MSKDALRQLHSKGVISSSSWVWAAGMQAPQQLCRVRELRWMLSTGLGLLGPFDAALVALQVQYIIVEQSLGAHSSHTCGARPARPVLMTS